MNSRNRTVLSAGFTALSIHYAYDLPASLNYALNFSKESSGTKISLLYTVYSAPNIFIPYIFCYNQSYFHRIHLVALSLIATFGQLVFTVGVFLNRFSIMLIGRAIAGIGGESYSVVQNKIIAQKFKVSDLTSAMALYSACVRTGALLTFLITPVLAHSLSTVAACIFASLLSLLGCLSTYNFCTKQDDADQAINPIDYQLGQVVESTVMEGIIQQPSTQEQSSYKLVSRLIITSHFIFCCIWSSFYSVAPMILQARFNMGPNTSSYAVSLLEAISLILTVLISYSIDKIGNNLNLSIAGSLLLFISHTNMVFNGNYPLLSMAILGFSSPLINLYLPCLARVVVKNRLFMIFAVMCCVANLGYSISPLCVAFLTLRDRTYLFVEIYMILMSLVGFGVLYSVSYINRKFDLKLNSRIG